MAFFSKSQNERIAIEVFFTTGFLMYQWSICRFKKILGAKRQKYNISTICVSEVAGSISVSAKMKLANDVVPSLMNTSLMSTDLSGSE